MVLQFCEDIHLTRNHVSRNWW